MLFLKIILILSAGTALITRLFAYEHAEMLAEGTAYALNTAGIISAVVCLVTGIALGLILKKKQKTQNNSQEENNNEKIN